MFPKKKTNSILLIFSIILLMLLFLFSVPIHAQNAVLKRQSVNMKIDKGFLLMSGLYFVSGPVNGISNLSFPFPFGLNYGELDSIHVYDVTNSTFLKHEEKGKESTNFTLEFDEKGESMIIIFYRLKLLGNKAEYPFSLVPGTFPRLDKACFYLIAPKNINVRNFNYQPKDTINAGNSIIYTWEMYDFKPEYSFEFRFANNK